MSLVADLDILFLRPSEPGSLVDGGDIDNRIKTLLDALRMPQLPAEIAANHPPTSAENPLFCLLQDDKLITSLSVTTDRLLDASDDGEVLLVIRVDIRSTETTMLNLSLTG